MSNIFTFVQFLWTDLSELLQIWVCCKAYIYVCICHTNYVVYMTMDYLEKKKCKCLNINVEKLYYFSCDFSIRKNVYTRYFFTLQGDPKPTSW